MDSPQAPYLLFIAETAVKREIDSTKPRQSLPWHGLWWEPQASPLIEELLAVGGCGGKRVFVFSSVAMRGS